MNQIKISEFFLGGGANAKQFIYVCSTLFSITALSGISNFTPAFAVMLTLPCKGWKTSSYKHLYREE